jgi:aerobic C4-dicarboxylate transport protein
VATVVVSAWEKELDRNKLRAVLRGEVAAIKETETAGA